jgi:hypothetical protein
MLRHVGFIRTDVSEERHSTSIIGVTRISELGTTLAVTSNRSKLERNSLLLTLFPALRFLLHSWWRRYVPPKRRFLQEPHGITSEIISSFNVSVCSRCEFSELLYVLFLLLFWSVIFLIHSTNIFFSVVMHLITLGYVCCFNTSTGL